MIAFDRARLQRLWGLGMCLFAVVLAAMTPPEATAAEGVANDLDDGPYVFRNGADLEAHWLCDGKALTKTLRATRPGATLKPRCAYPFPIEIAAEAEAQDGSAAPTGDRIVAVSDIHGQYGLLVRLLRAHGLIDARDRWRAGRDTLVVTGDVFDRGARVTETFWLLYRLQQQAQRAGGAVHFVLGNHEAMVLYGDLRYLHPRYVEIPQRLGRDYPALFGADTVIGQWLRTRPALLRLGDTLFLHGGIAPANVELVAERATVNADYQRSLGLPREALQADARLHRLYNGTDSPIWYRGYFDGQLDTAAVTDLVQRIGVARIVVGHTSMEQVGSHHGGRVIAIDSSIKQGESGELLFIEGDRLSRGLLDGRRVPLTEG